MAAPSLFLILAFLFLSRNVLAATSDSVAVIGAGFSGLSTAFSLVKAGYNNATIYDDQKRVGGYVSSVTFNGVSHDMATYALTPAYWKFQEAMESIGVSFCTLNVEVVNTTTSPPDVVKVLKFIANLGRQQIPNPTRYLIALQKQVKKYTNVWLNLFELSFVGDPKLQRTDRLFPLKPTDDDKLADLAMPMEDFGTKYGLELLAPLFVQATDSQAYGPYATTPALYYLSWVPPSLLTGNLGTIPCGK